MKKIISLLALVCLICSMFPISAFASSETEYIKAKDKFDSRIWYSDSRTKDALERLMMGSLQYYDSNGELTGGGVAINLLGGTIDIYDDLLLNESTGYQFRDGTIRCHNCRAFSINCDETSLELLNITIIDGEADGENYSENGYGGAIFVDGADCIIIGENCTIKNCHAEYGGAIAVSGHDCTISGITFKGNKAEDNGGTDLYVYWGDCRMNNCTFNSSSPNAHITADTYFDGCNITKEKCIGDLHQVFITNPTASILSVGYPEIVYGIGGLAVGFFAAMLIFRKKKVAVSSTSTDDEE